MKPGKSLPTSVDFHRLKYMEKVLFEESENTSGPVRDFATRGLLGMPYYQRLLEGNPQSHKNVFGVKIPFNCTTMNVSDVPQKLNRNEKNCLVHLCKKVIMRKCVKVEAPTIEE